MIVEMATGRKPLAGESARRILDVHCNAPSPDLRKIRPEIDVPLSRLIMKCLEKEP